MPEGPSDLSRPASDGWWPSSSSREGAQLAHEPQLLWICL